MLLQFDFWLQLEVGWRSASIMAENLPSKDASPATSSKLAGNPAFRMMGRSTHRRPASTFITLLVG